MQQSTYSYGMWMQVILSTAIFLAFAFSFTRPKSARDWRSFGAFGAFLLALFTEMYGFPLTIYLLSGWLQSRYPSMNIFGHNEGHLLHTLFGLKGNAHFDLFHIAGMFLLGFGFLLLGLAWKVLYKAQREGTLATTGPYATIRHPQYVAFGLILTGFLLQWPTILTVFMYPILLFRYWRLAKIEEKETGQIFGDGYAGYEASTPAFFPGFHGKVPDFQGKNGGKIS